MFLDVTTASCLCINCVRARMSSTSEIVYGTKHVLFQHPPDIAPWRAFLFLRTHKRLDVPVSVLDQLDVEPSQIPRLVKNGSQLLHSPQDVQRKIKVISIEEVPTGLRRPGRPVARAEGSALSALVGNIKRKTSQSNAEHVEHVLRTAQMFYTYVRSGHLSVAKCTHQARANCFAGPVPIRKRRLKYSLRS